MATAPFRSPGAPLPMLLMLGDCPLPSVRNITSGWMSRVESLRKTESETKWNCTKKIKNSFCTWIFMYPWTTHKSVRQATHRRTWFFWLFFSFSSVARTIRRPTLIMWFRPNRSFYIISMKTIVSNSLPFHQMESRNSDTKNDRNVIVYLSSVRCWPHSEIKNFTEQFPYKRHVWGVCNGRPATTKTLDSIVWNRTIKRVCMCERLLTVCTLHMWYATNFYGQLSTELSPLIFDLVPRANEKVLRTRIVSSVWMAWMHGVSLERSWPLGKYANAPNDVTAIHRMGHCTFAMQRICFVFVVGYIMYYITQGKKKTPNKLCTQKIVF